MEDGFGICEYPNGEKYEGKWYIILLFTRTDGLKDGEGIHINVDGNRVNEHYVKGLKVVIIIEMLKRITHLINLKLFN
jgi:hypothetical protein